MFLNIEVCVTLTSVGELRNDPKGMNRIGTLEQLYQACFNVNNVHVWNYLDLPMGHVTQDHLPKFRYVGFYAIATIPM